MVRRASKGYIVEQASQPTHSPQERQAWLDAASANFVGTPANARIYRGILELLWPDGSGIPGPPIAQEVIRAHIDDARAQSGKRLYRDPFRRMRELQGEEGFIGISKEGVRYQLQRLDVRAKRVPRAAPPVAVWQRIKQAANNRCANCGLQEPEVRLSPDHRVPRTRYTGPPEGLNAEANTQPLCEQCNNIKSTQCQGCRQNCQTCSWAYPDRYRPIQINDDNGEQLKREAATRGESAQDLANKILADYFNARRRR